MEREEVVPVRMGMFLLNGSKLHLVLLRDK